MTATQDIQYANDCDSGHSLQRACCAAPVRYEELEEAYTRWDIARWHSEVRKDAGWDLVLEESAARFDELAAEYEAQHNDKVSDAE